MSHIAVYGSVPMLRDHCPKCQSQAFILDGQFACCGREATDTVPHRVVGVVAPGGRRKLPSKPLQRTILDKQQHKCLYCDVVFGEPRWIRGKFTYAQICWDHLVPFAYLQANPHDNWGAACQTCNGLKSSTIFESLEEARAQIGKKLRARLSPVQDAVYVA